MPTTNAICIKWGDKFPSDYVNHLYAGVRRNIDGDLRFLCMTEDRAGIRPEVEILPLRSEPFDAALETALARSRRKGAFRKVSLFRPGLIPDLEGPLLGFDLDVVITGNLQPLLDFAPGKVCMRKDWVQAHRLRSIGHGSVFRFDPARHGYLYEDFATDPAAEVRKAHGSEQWYTSTTAMRHGDFAFYPEEWIASFKHDAFYWPPFNLFLAPRLPPQALVVCFHGTPKIDQAIEGYRGNLMNFTRPTQWVADNWLTPAPGDNPRAP
ncbi:MAG TPA: hypothetical protein VIL84_00475 [Devosiaceae bacterium]